MKVRYLFSFCSFAAQDLADIAFRQAFAELDFARALCRRSAQ